MGSFAGCGSEAEPSTRTIGLGDFEQRVGFCFSPTDVQVAAGAAFDPTASRARLRRYISAGVTATYRTRIRRARRLAAPENYADEIPAIVAAAKRGLSQLERRPELLRDGRVPGLLRAHRLAASADLLACSPAMNPAGPKPADLIIGAFKARRDGPVVWGRMLAVRIKENGAARRPIELRTPGYNPGDADFPFVYSDGTVAYRCSKGACAISATGSGRGRPIGEAWCLAPSADPGRIWLANPVQKTKNRGDVALAREVDIETGANEYGSIDIRGERLFCPVGSVTEGLLFQTDRQLVAIGPGGVIDRIDDVFPVATRDSLVASYDERGRMPVRELRITDVRSGGESWVKAPHGWRFTAAYGGGSISPDGRRIAALVSRTRNGILGCKNTAVALANTSGGRARVIGHGCGAVDFSPSGEILHVVGGPRRSGQPGLPGSPELSAYRLSGRRAEATVTDTGRQIVHLDSDG